MYEKGYRNVEYSRTEVSRCLRYPDINGQGRLFGGRLLAWIDEIAAIAATRHAGVNVTTAAILYRKSGDGVPLCHQPRFPHRGLYR